MSGPIAARGCDEAMLRFFAEAIEEARRLAGEALGALSAGSRVAALRAMQSEDLARQRLERLALAAAAAGEGADLAQVRAALRLDVLQERFDRVVMRQTVEAPAEEAIELF